MAPQQVSAREFLRSITSCERAQIDLSDPWSGIVRRKATEKRMRLRATRRSPHSTAATPEPRASPGGTCTMPRTLRIGEFRAMPGHMIADWTEFELDGLRLLWRA